MPGPLFDTLHEAVALVKPGTEKPMSSKSEHWNDVYAKRTPTEVSWFQPEARLSLELVDACGAPLRAGIIDVGAGASTSRTDSLRKVTRISRYSTSPNRPLQPPALGCLTHLCSIWLPTLQRGVPSEPTTFGTTGQSSIF